MKLLVVYSTCEGQTLKIAKAVVKESGFTLDQADFISLEDKACSGISIRDYQAVLIGASVRYGKFRPALYQFLLEQQPELKKIPSALFGVCLTARKAEKNRPDTNPYMQKLQTNAVWLPQLQAVFAGALLYSRYNWWQMRIIQLIMKITGGSTDTSVDIELTDWQAVKQFSQRLKQEFVQ